MTVASVRSVRTPALGLVVAMGCLGCGTAPLSYVEGTPAVGPLPHLHYPVRVVAVDGSMQFRMPVQVAPGPHMLVLEAAPGRSARGSVQRTYAFKIEPCTRYVFLARRASPMDADWELVVHAKEDVSSCDKEAELKKSSAIESSGWALARR